jgi:hypothetical protein
MKSKISLSICSTLVCMFLASCGGGGSANNPPAAQVAPAPPPPMTMQLDTAAVLAIVQTQTSETAEPFQVDDSAVEVVPVLDETSAPMSVDAS